VLLIHVLAVQRPNESNPLGVCCDIVKPVLSDWTQLLKTSGDPNGGGKGIAALRNSARFAIDPVVFAAITLTCRAFHGLRGGQSVDPVPIAMLRRVIESTSAY
jgi:hypothetical protein